MESTPAAGSAGSSATPAGAPPAAPIAPTATRLHEAGGLRFGSLKKRAFQLLMGNSVLMGCRFAITILLAKQASAELVGQYNLAMALTSPVVLFLSFNMRVAMVADARNETTYGNWFMTRNVGLIASLLAILAICVWKRYDGMSFEFLAIIFFVGLGKVFNQASDVCAAMYLKRERQDQAAVSGALTGLAMLVPFCLVFWPASVYCWSFQLPPGVAMTGTVWAVVLGAVAALLVYLWYDRPKVHHAADCDPRWSAPEVWRVLVKVFPLGVVMLVINLCDSLPRLIMEERTGGTEILGYFSALTTLALGANLLLIQVGIASTNRLAQYYNRDFRQFLRLTGKLTLLAIALGIVLMLGSLLVGRWMLEVFFKPAYANYYTEFLIVVGSQCLALLSSVFGITATQMRIYWLQVSIHITVLVVTVGAAWLLITPAAPVAGGAWTFFIRAAVQVLLYAGCVAWGIKRGFARTAEMPSVVAPDASQTPAG